MSNRVYMYQLCVISFFIFVLIDLLFKIKTMSFSIVIFICIVVLLHSLWQIYFFRFIKEQFVMLKNFIMMIINKIRNMRNKTNVKVSEKKNCSRVPRTKKNNMTTITKNNKLKKQGKSKHN